MSELLSTKEKRGRCRICGKFGKLTAEHIIPRNAGGGRKVELYDIVDVLEYGEKARYRQKQGGLTATTLCENCNNFLGRKYDKDFGRFYVLTNVITNDAINGILENGEIKNKNELIGKSVDLDIRRIKPLNIAKRLLASFCSIDYDNLIDRIPEIQKAILEPDYIPNTEDLAIFMSLKNNFYDTFFASMITFRADGGVECYAGIESCYTCFYLKDKHKNEKYPDTMDDCLNITNWLTDFKYNKEYDMQFTFPFIKTKTLAIPFGKKKN